MPAPTPRRPRCSASSLSPFHGRLCPHRDPEAPTVTSSRPPSPSRVGTAFSTGARLGAAPPRAAAACGPVGDGALVGAGGRASGPGGLGVAAEGGGGERGSPPGRAWVPGGSGQQAVAPCPAPAGRVGAVRYQSSSHLSRPVGGPTGGETATRPRTRGLQQLLSLPVPCLPESPAGLSAAGIGERPSLQLLKPERPPGSAPAPSSRRSRMAASRQGPSGSPPNRAASAPRRPRDAPAEEAALRVHLAG